MHGADQRQGRVELGTLDSGLAPGQWAAFYSGEECLGGGIIAERRDLYVCVGGDADVVGGRGGEGRGLCLGEGAGMGAGWLVRMGSVGTEWVWKKPVSWRTCRNAG